jgi:hypothetical protein
VALDYRIDRDPLVARLRGWDVIGFEEWLSLMATLRTDPLFAESMPIVLDLRDEAFGPPLEAAPQIAEAWRHFVPGHAVALVTRAGSAGFRLGEAVKALNGQVEVFTHIADALTWLDARRLSVA